MLSEGPKVLALADFPAEARLAHISAPVIVDDSVYSLDHRRADGVLQCIARLANADQVIVLSHDILLARKLLSLFAKLNRCI